ncbi:Serine/threonine-protein kinase GCN2 [Trichinella papuae]|uniref:Serine/threonine-protein kinase GCN2 n=1 Tax=Trichinella papuae TaxID=268474 RepID=A0A0V1N4B8_9BILA|nr:Serine/threonine-protein kinase GCN2 [Trichinella papuae]
MIVLPNCVISTIDTLMDNISTNTPFGQYQIHPIDLRMYGLKSLHIAYVITQECRSGETFFKLSCATLSIQWNSDYPIIDYPNTRLSEGPTKIACSDNQSSTVILFEMFYPMKTCMRPVEVLKELRKPVIIIPDDFLLMSKIDEVQKLLKLMLNHWSDQRPLSAALLNSELLPISEMEPVELHYNLNKVLENSYSLNVE